MQYIKKVSLIILVLFSLIGCENVVKEGENTMSNINSNQKEIQGMTEPVGDFWMQWTPWVFEQENLKDGKILTEKGKGYAFSFEYVKLELQIFSDNYKGEVRIIDPNLVVSGKDEYRITFFVVNGLESEITNIRFINQIVLTDTDEVIGEVQMEIPEYLLENPLPAMTAYGFTMSVGADFSGNPKLKKIIEEQKFYTKNLVKYDVV